MTDAAHRLPWAFRERMIPGAPQAKPGDGGAKSSNRQQNGLKQLLEAVPSAMANNVRTTNFKVTALLVIADTRSF